MPTEDDYEHYEYVPTYVLRIVHVIRYDTYTMSKIKCVALLVLRADGLTS